MHNRHRNQQALTLSRAEFRRTLVQKIAPGGQLRTFEEFRAERFRGSAAFVGTPRLFEQRPDTQPPVQRCRRTLRHVPDEFSANAAHLPLC
jgi:hypothetical protein